MNAQSLILTLGILGEVFQGGLFFGWSALSIMISDQGNYEEGCSNPDDTIEDPGTDICKSQESKLALLWTLGAFSLNSGPILGGFALDYLGPRFVAIAGVCLNMLGLICSVRAIRLGSTPSSRRPSSSGWGTSRSIWRNFTSVRCSLQSGG